MDWTTLKKTVPYLTGSPNHHTKIRLHLGDIPGGSISADLPGINQAKTVPPGGDFRVSATCPAIDWSDHVFSYVDLFEIYEQKLKVVSAEDVVNLARALVRVTAEGTDPELEPLSPTNAASPGLDTRCLLVASQGVALSEHRRYQKYEPLTGRYLPCRLILGILYGRWTSAQAAAAAFRGKQQFLMLRTKFGEEPSFEEVIGDKFPYAL